MYSMNRFRGYMETSQRILEYLSLADDHGLSSITIICNTEISMEAIR